MSRKNSLSVVVSAFNSEKELEGCLKSAAFAQEIIVVDNSSTDRTLEVARKYTEKVFVRQNNPMLNVNKNFGFSKATGEWILCLDADERVTTSLRDEIKYQMSNIKNNNTNGFWIPRKNIIFGKWIEHTGWYPDYQMRLFRRGRGRFEEKHVHEMIKIQGDAECLKGNLLHYNYFSISQFLGKLNIYIPNEAEQLIDSGYKFKWQDAISAPAKEFLSRFFAREGYRDGFHGLMLSLLMSFYHLLIIATVWEKRGFEKIEVTNIESEVKEEFRKSHKDLLFWINNEKLKKIKNPLKKIAYKIYKKIRTK